MNHFQPHVLVLPEDDATRQLANGFGLRADGRRMRVLPVARGWPAVRDLLVRIHVPELERYSHRSLVLVVDFDKDGERAAAVLRELPPQFRERVFVVGVWSEPERLRGETGLSLERLGTALAEACCDDAANGLWDHALLQHNKAELQRMKPVLKPILFPHLDGL